MGAAVGDLVGAWRCVGQSKHQLLSIDLETNTMLVENFHAAIFMRDNCNIYIYNYCFNYGYIYIYYAMARLNDVEGPNTM